MTLQVHRIGATDAEAIEAWHRIYVAVGTHDHPDSFSGAPISEIAQVLATPTIDHEFAAWLGFDGPEPVATGWYAGNRRSNLGRAIMTPRTHPEHRRRGHGSAMLAVIEAHAVSDGRTKVLSSPRWPGEAGPQGIGAPNTEFARRHGYDLKLVDCQRRLALPVPDELLTRMKDEADPAYTVIAFSGPVPDQYVEGWAQLDASLPTEAPSGDIDYEETPPSVESVREQEQILARSGALKFNAVAIAPDGSAVGYTDIVVTPGDAPAQQWGTLVRRAHRGHRLGGALKAAVLELIQTERPEVTATVTSNALTNTAMVAVNERLGYDVVNYVGDVEKELS